MNIKEMNKDLLQLTNDAALTEASLETLDYSDEKAVEETGKKFTLQLLSANVMLEFFNNHIEDVEDMEDPHVKSFLGNISLLIERLEINIDKLRSKINTQE